VALWTDDAIPSEATRQERKTHAHANARRKQVASTQHLTFKASSRRQIDCP
jgi:hypothetical protein